MEDRYVQQFKKGSLEMILLSLIGRIKCVANVDLKI